MQELQNPNTFGRPYGIPLLAHDDPYGGYDAHSVYPEWNFLVFKGLKYYGFHMEARQLAERLFEGIGQTLKDYHDFYESNHSDEQRPSDSWLHTYIWTGVVARMLVDLQSPPVEVEDEWRVPLPVRYTLKQNFPNPFNATTVIEFSLPRPECVALRIFNVLGQHIKTLTNDMLQPGTYRLFWDGTDDKGDAMSSGVYFYQFKTGSYVQLNKMILLR